MKFLKPFLLLSLTLFVFSCSKNQSDALDELKEQSQDIPAELQTIMEEAMTELAYDYNNPPMYDGVTFRGATVYLPAGSMDGLAEAIEEAGVNGKVIVKSGDHWESGTVTITQTVRIEGETGAKIYFDVSEKGGGLFGPVTNIIDPAIYVRDANFVKIKGLTILPQKPTGNTGIFLEDARFARIEKNRIENFQYCVWLSGGSLNAGIYDNHIENVNNIGNRGVGVVVEDGKYSKLKGNYIKGFAHNLFASSSHGIAQDNEFDAGNNGIIFCTFQGNMQLPNGNMLEKAVSCTKWKAIDNYSHHNRNNYRLIDGANDNFLFRNKADNAVIIDVKLDGPLIIGGAPALAASDNFVVNPSSSITYQDCGDNNVILAGMGTLCQ